MVPLFINNVPELSIPIFELPDTILSFIVIVPLPIYIPAL